jgi:DNA ligase (NAD+)
VRVCRSGLVIPKIEKVVKPAEHVFAPTKCPSCGGKTEWEGDFLYCRSSDICPAQIETTIEYFFKTIGNCDGFGPKVIEQICKQGYSSVVSIYKMDQRDFESCGLGAGISANLCAELNRSQREPIEDWRFLAAFGINNVGKGGCERLLKHHRLETVFDLTVEDLIAIDGFAEKTATILYNALKRIRDDFNYLSGLGFNLTKTPLVSEQSATESPVLNKTIVFTGTLRSGKRDDLEKTAKLYGAKIGSSVSSKTDFLVCGENVGANKTEAAKKHGVKVISEADYLALFGIKQEELA